VDRDLHYDTVTIVLHWLTAGLIAALWLSAQIIGLFGQGTPEVYLRSLHITLGAVLAAVMATRIVWRLATGHSPAGTDTGFLEQIARVMHYALYIVAGVVVLLGCLTVWMQGDSIWNLVTVPAYDPGNIPLGRQMRGWHGLAANFILILTGLHAAAALFHHYLLQDDVLRRMLPARWRKRI
jgi:cytochrome b561